MGARGQRLSDDSLGRVNQVCQRLHFIGSLGVIGCVAMTVTATPPVTVAR
ncbi:hypothetical protein IHE33_04890 [Mycetohabitans endofungorum]